MREWEEVGGVGGGGVGGKRLRGRVCVCVCVCVGGWVGGRLVVNFEGSWRWRDNAVPQ